MKKLEKQAIIKVIEDYCDDEQTPEGIAKNMGTDGIDFCNGGGLAIYTYDMLQELRTVYGENFDASVYLKKYKPNDQYSYDVTGSDFGLEGVYDYRYRNGIPYVHTVYCQKFGTVLNELKDQA